MRQLSPCSKRNRLILRSGVIFQTRTSSGIPSLKAHMKTEFISIEQALERQLQTAQIACGIGSLWLRQGEKRQDSYLLIVITGARRISSSIRARSRWYSINSRPLS